MGAVELSILDKAPAALFAEKGYDSCSVNDILNAVGIAKGTFYYYFKSKEDVLDAAVEQVSEQIMEKIRKVADEKELSPADRIVQVLLAAKVSGPTEEVLINEMHKTQNALLHQKTLVSIITMLTPVLTEIVKEGNGRDVFSANIRNRACRFFCLPRLPFLTTEFSGLKRRKLKSCLKL